MRAGRTIHLSSLSALALAACFIAVAFVTPLPAQAEALRRHQVDAQELRNEQVLRPQVAAQIERGEAALAANNFAAAADLFQKAVAGSPHSALPRRRLCIAQLAQGRRAEAIQSCQAAAANLGSAIDFRALVGALMSAPPTPAELAAALGYAQRAIQLMDREPYGYAAQCDIMRRLGDTEMLTQCLDDLQRVAPHIAETTRAQALVAGLRTPVRTALIWGGLALVTLLTALHALRARLRRPSLALILALATGLSFAPRASRAAESSESPEQSAGGLSKYPVDPKDPSSSIPTPAQRDANPLEYGYFLMDVADQAAKATNRGDHQAAARYWMALYKAVPDRSVSLTKACASYEAAGDIENAIKTCKLALKFDGVLVNDFARFVSVSLKKPGALSAQELTDIDAVIKHLEETGAEHAVVDELNCNVAMKQNDLPRLEACSSSLAARVPDHPQTIYYQWAAAILKGDSTAARRLVERAKFVHSNPQRIEEMQRKTAETSSIWWRLRSPRVLLGAGILLLAAAALILVIRSLRARSVPHASQV
jgi:tetratricopeptide (TPR) repeat protein